MSINSFDRNSLPFFSFSYFQLMFQAKNIAFYFVNRLGSRFRVNETSQISERYSVERKAAMKQKRLVMCQMYLSKIEYPKHDSHSAFGHKRLCYSRATFWTFILNLLYFDAIKRQKWSILFMSSFSKNQVYC